MYDRYICHCKNDLQRQTGGKIFEFFLSGVLDLQDEGRSKNYGLFIKLYQKTSQQRTL